MKKKAEKAENPCIREPNILRQDAFIAAYIKHLGNKAAAARELDIPYTTVMDWLKMEDFMSRLKVAEEELFDELHASLFSRAGKTSDILGMFFMKKMKPELFDDNIRKLKYQRDNDMPTDGTPPQITFMRSDEPTRLKKRDDE